MPNTASSDLNSYPVITMASSEIVPFAKTGGLADVVGALSYALAQQGAEVNLVMPAYREVIGKHLAGLKPYREINIHIGSRVVDGQLYKKVMSVSLTAYFVRADDYFDRECLYGDESGDYPDNAERFAFFSRAVLEVARITHSKIIHLHDWQAAPAAAFLKIQPERYAELSAAKVFLTIHNLAYQGLFSNDHWPSLDLDWRHFNPSQFEYWGKINYLKSGLVAADRLTTVSPTYAREIQQDGGGFGLEGVFRGRFKDLTGILNGIDYAVWNPETDSYINNHFSSDDLSGKSACKAFIQECYGLKPDPSVPLACVVTRMVEGKGLELIMEAAQRLLKQDVQLVVLGRGNPQYETFFSDLASRNSGRVIAKIIFDEAAAHQLIAGADILLMPSEREPCGLTQMYAARYGTIAVVRRTGGLADSVEPFDPVLHRGTGFLFDDFSADSLLESIEQALSVFSHKTEWEALIRRAMAADHSWNRSMQEYLRLYRGLTQD
jgi:starch synthase